MPLTLRSADLGDVPRLCAMIHALARHHGDTPTVTEATLHRDLFGPSPRGRALVAELAGQAVGYALLVPVWQAQTATRRVDLQHLFVEAEVRGQGIGRALVAAAREEARESGAQRLTVGTHPDNARAAALYQALDFAETPVAGRRFALDLAADAPLSPTAVSA